MSRSGAGYVPATALDPFGNLAAQRLSRVQRLRVRNDWRNPRANPPSNGWGHTEAGSPTGVTFTQVTGDADVGDGAEYSFTLGAGATQVVTLGTSVASWAVPVQPGQIALCRLKVKLTAQGSATDCPVTLQANVYQSNGSTVVSNRVVKSLSRLVLGSAVTLEGLEYGQTNAAYLQLALNIQAPTSGTWTVRIGQAQIVIDPDGPAAAYIDGSKWNGSWLGTADQSPSEGWADAPANPTYLGFNDNSVSQSAATGNVVTSPAQVVALMDECGANLWRGGINPAAAWPSAGGSPNWRNHELAPLFDALQNAGLKACPIIGNATTWMTTGNTGFITDLQAGQHAAWKQLYTSLVQTWPSVITAVEFYNEPNLAATWSSPSAANYTALMIEMHDALKAVAPSITFVGGSLARYYGTDASGIDTGTFLAGMYTAGAKGYMDAISVHPYSNDPSTAQPTSPAGLTTGFDNTLKAARDARHNAGDDATPLWVTEVGFNTSGTAFTEQQQARMVLLTKGILRRSGDVNAVCFHTLTADTTMAANARGYELVEFATLRRKPAFRALGSNVVPTDTDPPLAGLNRLQLQTFDPTLASSQLQYTSTFIIVAKVWVPQTVSVQTMWVSIGTAGSSLTSGRNLLGIYNPQGKLLGQTADQTTAWASTGNISAALQSGPIVIPGGPGRWVWAALLSTGTTVPKFWSLSVQSPVNEGLPNFAPVPGADVRIGYENAGARTSLVSLAGLNINNAFSQIPWIGFS